MYRFIGLSVYRLPIDIRSAPKPFGFGARFLFLRLSSSVFCPLARAKSTFSRRESKAERLIFLPYYVFK